MKKIGDLMGWAQTPELQEVEQRMSNMTQLENINFWKQQAIDEAGRRNNKPPEGIYGDHKCTICNRKRCVYYVNPHPVDGASCIRLFPVHCKPCVCVLDYYDKDDYGNLVLKSKDEVPKYLGGKL